jgi:hypothetical protein
MFVRLAAVALIAVVSAVLTAARATLPVRAAFDGERSEHTWTLEQLNPELPSDWTPYDFLVVEFKASSSQRFYLGIDTGQVRIAKRIGPFAGVWVRAAIPLRFYREPAGSAGDLAATYNQPRGSYWINIDGGGHGPTTAVRGLTVRMDHPVGRPTLEIRSVALSKADLGDAVLEGKPLVDPFGQYRHASWPGKVESIEQLKAAWRREDDSVKTALSGRCQYGGFADTRAKATGFSAWNRLTGGGGSSIRTAICFSLPA